MGLGFVLLAWAIILTAMAAVASLILGTTTLVFTRKAEGNRRKPVLAAVIFPFACLAWLAIRFVVQASVNMLRLHRDPGMKTAFIALFQMATPCL
jgi:hypothetical protein